MLFGSCLHTLDLAFPLGPMVELTCLSPKSSMASLPPAVKSGLCKAASVAMVSLANLAAILWASNRLISSGKSSSIRCSNLSCICLRALRAKIGFRFYGIGDIFQNSLTVSRFNPSCCLHCRSNSPCFDAGNLSALKHATVCNGMLAGLTVEGSCSFPPAGSAELAAAHSPHPCAVPALADLAVSSTLPHA